MNEHEKINYVEFPAKDIEAAKAFFNSAFGWSFVDYGPEYAAFSDEGLNGGFYKSELSVSTERVIPPFIGAPKSRIMLP